MVPETRPETTMTFEDFIAAINAAVRENGEVMINAIDGVVGILTPPAQIA